MFAVLDDNSTTGQSPVEKDIEFIKEIVKQHLDFVKNVDLTKSLDRKNLHIQNTILQENKYIDSFAIIALNLVQEFILSPEIDINEENLNVFIRRRELIFSYLNNQSDNNQSFDMSNFRQIIEQ